MKLATQVNEKMRETSNVWAPPIYRRLISADKREKDMSERCLLKIKSTIYPPPIALSKVHKEKKYIRFTIHTMNNRLF